MEDFETIRLKEIEELTDSDKDVLKQHAEELTDDEKGIFKDIITEEKKEEKEFKFGSQEEFDNAVTERTEAILAEKEKARKEEEEKAKQGKEGEEERYFPEGYQAKDWNEAAKEMFPKFREKIFKEQNEVRQKTQETLDNINKEFDAEIEAIAAEDKTIPTKGTPERETFETELSQIGVEYQGVTNMTQAYKIWKALNTGGKKQEVGEKQKSLAEKVGRTGGEGETVKKRSYKEIAGRSMDELIDQDLEEMGVKT